MGGSRSHSEFFFGGKSYQNSPKPALIFFSSIPYMCILSKDTLLKVVGYYDLSVLSMSVMGLKKKHVRMGGGWMGGWGEFYIQFFLGFLEFF